MADKYLSIQGLGFGLAGLTHLPGFVTQHIILLIVKPFVIQVAEQRTSTPNCSWCQFIFPGEMESLASLGSRRDQSEA
jgi:hypothetical protein